MTEFALAHSPARLHRSRFTIYHGLAVSLVIHAAIAIPFLLRRLEPPPPDSSLLSVELDGFVSDTQTAKQVMEETKGEVKQDEQQAVKPVEKVETPPEEVPPEPVPEKMEPVPKQEVVKDPTEDTLPAPPPPVTQPEMQNAVKSADAGAQDIKGQKEQQDAQTLKKQRDEEIDRLKAYVRSLSKKVQDHLVYPDGGHRAQGTTMVAFTITASGLVKPESIKVVESSGKPQLDEGAIKTIRASSPFEAPPKEVTVAIAVAFGKKP